MRIMDKKILYAIFTLVILLIITFTWEFFSTRPAYTTPQAAVSSETGLVAYWNLDEGSGTKSYDYTKINNGTLYSSTTVCSNPPTSGCPTWTTGKYGKALQFDGTNDYVQVPHHSSLAGFIEFTASFWLKPGDITRRQVILGKYDDANGKRSWFIDYPSYVANKIGFFASQDGTNYKQWYAPFTPVVNTWFHVAVVWKANTVPKFYINGQQISTSGTDTITKIYNNVGVPLIIGKSPYMSGRELKGTLDEIKIWSRALTAEEVLNEYNGGAVQKCSDGTSYGSCNTTNKPKYCSSGTIIDKCSQCGCPSGQSCNTTTNACYVPKCSDGTSYDSCSATKPKYCSNGTIIDKCSQCGCPTGYTCKSDGTCLSDLGGYWNLDEGSGSIARDSSPNKNNGTVNGSTWVTDKLGKALQFDGTNDYVQVPHHSSLAGFIEFTASFWLKPGDITRRQVILGKYDDANGKRSWFIDYPSYVANKIGFFASQDGTNYKQWYAPFTPVVNTWFHVAVVWKANTVPKFYINGQQISTSGTDTITKIYNNVGVPLIIGKSPYMSGRELKGTLDEIKIWSRALTAEEVLNEYNGGAVQKCSDGTSYGSCNTTNKPKYCSNGNLVNKCTVCGCPSNQSCNSTTDACYTPVTCTCGTWTNGACGGSCSSGYRQQTRTCTPTGCSPTDGLGTSRCVNDTTCGVTTGMITGINYLSNGNGWTESNSTLDADFSRFSNDGIKHISVRMMWSVMEPTHSDNSTNLNPTALGNIKRVLTEANKYGIKVNLDFWTQHGSTLGLPSWVGSYWDIEAISTTRDHYVRYMQTVVNQLKSYPALESWTVLNEPYFGTASNGQSAGKAEFQTAFPILYNAIKSVDPNHIVTCRFTLSYTPGSGSYDASVYDVFDVFAITEYLDPSNPSDTRYNGRWSYWDKTVSDLKAKNKPFWVIEFGDDNTNTEHVRLHYEQSLLKFNATGIVERAYSWAWQTGNAAAEAFNIYNGTSPKPAYYELTQKSIVPTGTIWGANLYVPKLSDNNPSGYAATYLSNTVFQAAKDMGITHLIIWQKNFNEGWYGVKPAPTITTAQMVDAVNRMKNYGLKPIIVLDYNVADAVALVQALGSNCDMYEVCKEPHVDGSSCNTTATDYANKWNAVVNAARQVNPNAMYGGPAVGAIPGTSPRSETWMREWLNKCDGDFVSVHAFYDPIDSQSNIVSRARTETTSDVAYLKGILSDYGKQNLPIFYTEVQWTAAPSTNGWDMDQTFNNDFANSLMSTMEEQNVYAAMYWVLIGYNNNFAIIRPPSQSYQKKPQFYSIQNYTSAH